MYMVFEPKYLKLNFDTKKYDCIEFKTIAKVNHVCETNRCYKLKYDFQITNDFLYIVYVPYI